MLNIKEIKEIIRLVDESSISEFSYEHEGSEVTIKKADTTSTAPIIPNMEPISTAAPQPEKMAKSPTSFVEQNNESETAQQENADENVSEIISPMVGTFYRKPTPDSDTFVELGDNVKHDSIVCIVEAMKLFNEIESETSGEIIEILVNDGELVEYGQPLFKVKTK